MTAHHIASSANVLNRPAGAGLVCLFLGLTLLAGVGFAGPEVLHNAAHDTRHAIGFPCH